MNISSIAMRFQVIHLSAVQEGFEKRNEAYTKVRRISNGVTDRSNAPKTKTGLLALPEGKA